MTAILLRPSKRLVREYQYLPFKLDHRLSEFPSTIIRQNLLGTEDLAEVKEPITYIIHIQNDFTDEIWISTESRLTQFTLFTLVASSCGKNIS